MIQKLAAFLGALVCRQHTTAITTTTMSLLRAKMEEKKKKEKEKKPVGKELEELE
ncbi:unnamed protein product [Cercospora beticola]|nr:unnamed protein product [Cercospora beticola]